MMNNSVFTKWASVIQSAEDSGCRVQYLKIPEPEARYMFFWSGLSSNPHAKILTQEEQDAEWAKSRKYPKFLYGHPIKIVP